MWIGFMRVSKADGSGLDRGGIGRHETGVTLGNRGTQKESTVDVREVRLLRPVLQRLHVPFARGFTRLRRKGLLLRRVQAVPRRTCETARPPQIKQRAPWSQNGFGEPMRNFGGLRNFWVSTAFPSIRASSTALIGTCAR
jgi:hypothetical protein